MALLMVLLKQILYYNFTKYSLDRHKIVHKLKTFIKGGVGSICRAACKHNVKIGPLLPSSTPPEVCNVHS